MISKTIGFRGLAYFQTHPYIYIIILYYYIIFRDYIYIYKGNNGDEPMDPMGCRIGLHMTSVGDLTLST